MKELYFVYILKCSDSTYYTGISNNVELRLKKHNLGKGAKYTRGRRPCELVYLEECENKSVALKREYYIKHKMTKLDKERLILESVYKKNDIIV